MNPEAEALARFHTWADTRRQRHQRRDGAGAIVAFLIRYALGYVLLWISGTATELARRVVPVP